MYITSEKLKSRIKEAAREAEERIDRPIHLEEYIAIPCFGQIILRFMLEGEYYTLEDLDRLEKLSSAITKAALCGLGKTAPNPVLSTLRYFKDEYIEHIRGLCRTGVCKDMVKYQVSDDCVGCTKCAKVCPADAIEYQPYQKHSIDTHKCTQCGLCIGECSYQAIKKVPLHEDLA